MVFLFREKSILSFAFLIMLCLLVHTHLFYKPLLINVTGDDGLISYFLQKDIARLPKGILIFVYVALILLQAIRLDLLLSTYKMFNTEGNTTALAYVLLSGFFTQWCSLSSALVANTFIIWIFIQLTKLYNNPAPKSLLFNSGLIVGATILCYQPTAILIVVVVFSVAIIRPFNISEYIVLLMGIVMPFYLIFSLLYLYDKMDIINSFIPNLQFHIPTITNPFFFWINFAATILLLLLGLNSWSAENGRMLIHIRKNWSAMLVMALIILPVPFVFKNSGIESAMLSMMPLAAFISNFFLYPKKLLFPNIFFWVAVAVVVCNNWLLFKN